MPVIIVCVFVCVVCVHVCVHVFHMCECAHLCTCMWGCIRVCVHMYASECANVHVAVRWMLGVSFTACYLIL